MAEVATLTADLRKARASNGSFWLVRQPVAGDGERWARLAQSLRAEIDEESIEAYRGTVSLLLEAGSNRRIAVKVVDDCGIESLRILELE